jgi:hypothetical protein
VIKRLILLALALVPVTLGAASLAPTGHTDGHTDCAERMREEIESLAVDAAVECLAYSEKGCSAVWSVRERRVAKMIADIVKQDCDDYTVADDAVARKQ